MTITLREITADTVREIIRLSVAPDQEQFVANNATSLAQALFSDQAWYRAVYQDETPVGFVMLHDESMGADPADDPEIGLWRLMIDQRYQGQGIGRDVVLLVADHVRSLGRFTHLHTSYVLGEGSPEAFYLRLGFVPTGEVDDDEVIAALPL